MNTEDVSEVNPDCCRDGKIAAFAMPKNWLTL
jgi:hypothetical protein